MTSNVKMCTSFHNEWNTKSDLQKSLISNKKEKHTFLKWKHALELVLLNALFFYCKLLSHFLTKL